MACGGRTVGALQLWESWKPPARLVHGSPAAIQCTRQDHPHARSLPGCRLCWPPFVAACDGCVALAFAMSTWGTVLHHVRHVAPSFHTQGCPLGSGVGVASAWSGLLPLICFRPSPRDGQMRAALNPRCTYCISISDTHSVVPLPQVVTGCCTCAVTALTQVDNHGADHGAWEARRKTMTARLAIAPG